MRDLRGTLCLGYWDVSQRRSAVAMLEPNMGVRCKEMGHSLCLSW